MNKLISDKVITINEEGYLTNFTQWNQQIGEEIAKENNITLTPRHWDVIHYLQEEFKKESPLSIRKIGKSGIVDIKELYSLFPEAPLKTATKIAGIPKPTSCI